MLVYVKNNVVIDVFPAENIIFKLMMFPEIRAIEAPEFVQIGWQYDVELDKFAPEQPL